jgi:hypothetical protein
MPLQALAWTTFKHVEDITYFFHFTSVLGTKDNHLLLSEVDRDRGGGGHAGGEAVGRESTSVVDCVVGVEVLELLAARPDEHVAHEESMVGASADNANVDAVALVPAGEAIDNVDAVTGVEVVDSALAVDTPDLFGKIVSYSARMSFVSCAHVRVEE